MSAFSRLWDSILSKLFPKVDRYELPPRVLRTMQALAIETHPKEAFGVLRGKHRGRVLRVDNIAFQPFTNTQTSAQVALDPYVLPDMVGTFHSHPSPNDWPSAADKRLFARHPGIHCIIAYPYTSVAVYNSKGQRISLHKL